MITHIHLPHSFRFFSQIQYQEVTSSLNQTISNIAKKTLKLIPGIAISLACGLASRQTKSIIIHNAFQSLSFSTTLLIHFTSISILIHPVYPITVFLLKYCFNNYESFRMFCIILARLCIENLESAFAIARLLCLPIFLSQSIQKVFFIVITSILTYDAPYFHLANHISTGVAVGNIIRSFVSTPVDPYSGQLFIYAFFEKLAPLTLNPYFNYIKVGLWVLLQLINEVKNQIHPLEKEPLIDQTIKNSIQKILDEKILTLDELETFMPKAISILSLTTLLNLTKQPLSEEERNQIQQRIFEKQDQLPDNLKTIYNEIKAKEEEFIRKNNQQLYDHIQSYSRSSLSLQKYFQSLLSV